MNMFINRREREGESVLDAQHNTIQTQEARLVFAYGANNTHKKKIRNQLYSEIPARCIELANRANTEDATTSLATAAAASSGTPVFQGIQDFATAAAVAKVNDIAAKTRENRRRQRKLHALLPNAACGPTAAGNRVQYK